MKPRLLPAIPAAAIAAWFAAPALAFPPAPFHRIHGMIRDDLGNPLGSGDAVVILSDADNREIVRAPTDAASGTGINYSLAVSMDHGLREKNREPDALQSAYPFTIRVVKGGLSFVPIQMQGTDWAIGEPSGSTRIDLTLGLDSDGDGLPDAWELETIRTSPPGRFTGIDQIEPGGDADGDGFTNYQEYIAGTYASNPKDGLFLYIRAVDDDTALLEFLAIARRTYRVRTSLDAESFTDQPFSVVSEDESSPAGPPVPSFRALQSGIVRIHVPIDDASRRLFRLHID